MPANARAAEFLPYDELLPRTDVYVTNSGYGGVRPALRRAGCRANMRITEFSVGKHVNSILVKLATVPSRLSR